MFHFLLWNCSNYQRAFLIRLLTRERADRRNFKPVCLFRACNANACEGSGPDDQEIGKLVAALGAIQRFLR